VEYRRDAAGNPLLMEINARLAGPLETLLRSGFDLPLMVWRWAAGLPVATAGDFQAVRTRWLRGDLRWLRENFYRVGRPDSVSRSRAFWDFGTEFLRSGHYDSVDWRDPRPIVTELRTTAHSVRVASHKPAGDRVSEMKRAQPRTKGDGSEH
jgi:hypothetical protein